IHQHWWLPLFAGLTWLYTILGFIGGWLVWRSRIFQARLLLVFAALVIFLRLGFLSTMENPEPRYTVEFFPLLAILGGIALAHLLNRPFQKLSDKLQHVGRRSSAVESKS